MPNNSCSYFLCLQTSSEQFTTPLKVSYRMLRLLESLELFFIVAHKA